MVLICVALAYSTGAANPLKLTATLARDEPIWPLSIVAGTPATGPNAEPNSTTISPGAIPPLRVAEALTVRVTVTIWAVPTAGVTVTLPVYEPGASASGETEILKGTLPVPVSGETVSQAAPSVVMGAAVKLCDPATCTFCAG